MLKKQPTKTRILDAAEELILENGIENVTIAKIAKKANVADSLAYKYFKGKDDIIFSVVAERTREEIAMLQKQLQRISDPKSMLSKMIWCMLKYNDSHRNHAKNLLFQCRSNKNFYKSEAYSLMKEYETIIMNTLNQGIQKGVFRSDIDMRLIRYMIFGTIDVQALTCTITGENDEGSRDLKDIMSFLLPVITRKEKPGITDKKEAIMRAAEKIFAREGFASAKTASIAEMAHVTEGTIYDYFTGKEELLFAISDKHLKAYLDNIPYISNNRRSSPAPAEKLWKLMRSFCLTFLAMQDFMTIYFMHTLFNNRYYHNYQANVHPKQNKFSKMLDDIIQEGKKDGSFRENVNSRIFGYMFLGSYTHLVLRWILIENKELDKYTETRNLMALLLTAVLKDPPTLGYLISIEF